MKPAPLRCTRTSLFLALLLSLAMPPAQAAEHSLYERLGGLAPISVVVSDFIDALVVDTFLNANPAVDQARQRVPAPYLKYRVTSLLCQASGGPCEYRGSPMKETHAHLNISSEEWERMITVLKQILDRYQVPTRERQEVLDIVGNTRADIVTGP